MLINLVFLTVGYFSQAQDVPSSDAVRDLPPPTIALESHDGVFEKGKEARIECRSPGYHLGSTFYLKQDGEDMYILQITVPDGEDTATFDIKNLTIKQQGNYRCFYRNQKSGRWKRSTLSDPVQIIVLDKTLKTPSPEPPRIQENVWTLTGIVAGGVTLILIITAIVWHICRKKSKSRRRRNEAANLWTTFDDNINTPSAVGTRRGFMSSQDLEHSRQEEEGSAYYANHSTEFLNDMQLTPRGLHKKPYFVTFQEQ
ncbi:uncharacterized protein [Heptranchias perlo]|uniref:uncharacterized protein n=1 Tax=Heptranchias perlo TaxID=212740 RepID=UPI003559ADA7